MLIKQFCQPGPLPLSSAVLATIIIVELAIFRRVSGGRERRSRRLDFRSRRRA